MLGASFAAWRRAHRRHVAHSRKFAVSAHVIVITSNDYSAARGHAAPPLVDLVGPAREYPAHHFVAVPRHGTVDHNPRVRTPGQSLRWNHNEQLNRPKRSGFDLDHMPGSDARSQRLHRTAHRRWSIDNALELLTKPTSDCGLGLASFSIWRGRVALSLRLPTPTSKITSDPPESRVAGSRLRAFGSARTAAIWRPASPSTIPLPTRITPPFTVEGMGCRACICCRIPAVENLAAYCNRHWSVVRPRPALHLPAH